MTSPEVIFTICRRTTASPYYILKSLLSTVLRKNQNREFLIHYLRHREGGRGWRRLGFLTFFLHYVVISGTLATQHKKYGRMKRSPKYIKSSRKSLKKTARMTTSITFRDIRSAHYQILKPISSSYQYF